MSQAPRWLDALQTSAVLPVNKPFHAYQLATVDAEGRPRVRTIGPQGFIAPEGHPALPIALLMTDARTAKAAELRTHPRAELVRHLSGSHEQFRLAGRARVVAAPGSPFSSPPTASEGEGTLARLDEQDFDWEGLRAQVFNRCPDFIRASLLGSAPGGAPAALELGRPAVLPKLGEAGSAEEERLLQEAFGNFAVVAVEVDEVDWCDLGAKPQLRTRFALREGKWEESAVAP